MPDIICTDVHYAYGRRQALRGLTATFAEGLVGLLGPNGAGKSTLMSILATLRRPGQGTISAGDVPIEDAAAMRRLIGYLPQRFSVIGSATVRRNVEYAAWARGVERDDCPHAADIAMERVGLLDHARDKARSLSGGYRQRLGLACAIAHEPSILLLDEPTVAIDPVQRMEVRQLLMHLAEHSTVLVATHLVEDVALAGSQVVIINEGRALFSGTVDELTRRGESLPVEGASPLEIGYRAVLMGVG